MGTARHPGRDLAEPAERWDAPPAELRLADAPGGDEPGVTADADAFGLDRSELKHRSLRGIFFLTFSNFANLGIGFLSSLVLARLLTPADFGVVAVGTTATLLA